MISILIPTMNRSDFLIRALNYYHTVKFKGCICVGDSSNDQHVEKIQRAIQALDKKLTIIYRHFPSPPYTNDALCLKELIDLAPTPYAAYAGDDDFVVPRTLEQCTAFLETHPDYSAVNGVSVTVGLQSGGAQGQLAWARYVGAHRLESDKAVERWIGYMRQSISTQYYVHRTETWRRMYRDVPAVSSRYLGPELLPCSLTAILGKVREIDGLACVLQANESKHFGWRTHSMYALMTDDNWTPSVQALRESIVEALLERDGITRQEAQEIFDKEFWRHILFMLQWHYELHHDEPLNVYDRLKRMRRLVAFYLRLKQIRAGKNHRHISLSLLLNPSFPYLADFLPIYQAITSLVSNHPT